MTTLVMAAILLVGAMGYRLLPVSDLPNVDFPTIQVTASLPGASPETMAASVATPLERQFSAIAGLDSSTRRARRERRRSRSSSRSTATSTRRRRTSRRRSRSRAPAPRRACRRRPPPEGQPGRPAGPLPRPLLARRCRSRTVDEYAETLIAQRLSTICGVAQVQVSGAQKYAVRVQLDPPQLAARGIGIDEVATSIQRANVEPAVGTLYGRPPGPHRAGERPALRRRRSTGRWIVAYRNGCPCASATWAGHRRRRERQDRDLVPTPKQVDRRSPSSASPGTNTIDVVDAVKAKLPTFRAQLPARVKLDVLFDRSVRSASRSTTWSSRSSSRSPSSSSSSSCSCATCRRRSSRASPCRSRSSARSPRCTLLDFSLDNLSLMALTLVGRLRRGRRDRHAREHRPPHGGGRTPLRPRSRAARRSASRSSR